jgi:putative transposase
MLKAIKIRLYPTIKQQILLNNHFNGCRFIYNNALEYKKILYQDYKINKSKIDIMNELPNIKEEFTWLKEIKAECLQNVIDNLDKTFKGFFRGNGYPKFKSKKSHQSFTSNQNFKILDNTNKIVFLKNKIKFKCSENDIILLKENKIKRITYSKNKANQYFASILIEFTPNSLKPNNNEVGIDLGIKHFLITSDGEFVENPKYLIKLEKKLKKQQKNLSRKIKGSNNRNKQRLKVAKIHQKIQNQRDYFLHNISNKIISENQTIFVETLQIKNMVKNHKLAKSISDVSWGKFIQLLEYKSKWYGRDLIKINTFEPSSKLCNNCGFINKELTLNHRIFECPICDYKENRDINAAKNIKQIGRNYPEFKLVEENNRIPRKQEKNLLNLTKIDENL